MRIDLASSFNKLRQQPTETEGSNLAVLTDDQLANDDKLKKFQESSILITCGTYDPITHDFFDLKNASGVVISPDGLVCTAKHFLEKPDVKKILKSRDDIDDDIKAKIFETYKQYGISYLARIPILLDNGDLVLETLQVDPLATAANNDIGFGSIDLSQRVEVNSPGLVSSILKPGPVRFGEQVLTMSHPNSYPVNIMTSGEVFNAEFANLQMLADNKSHPAIVEEFADDEAFQAFPSSPEILAKKYASLHSKTETDPDDMLYATNYIAVGSSGGGLYDSEGSMIGMPVAYSALNDICLRHGITTDTKSHHETADNIILALKQQFGNDISLQTLLNGEEVNAPALLRKASQQKLI